MTTLCLMIRPVDETDTFDTQSAYAVALDDYQWDAMTPGPTIVVDRGDSIVTMLTGPGPDVFDLYDDFTKWVDGAVETLGVGAVKVSRIPCSTYDRLAWIWFADLDEQAQQVEEERRAEALLDERYAREGY